MICPQESGSGRAAFGPDVEHRRLASELGATAYSRDVVEPVMGVLSKWKEPG